MILDSTLEKTRDGLNIFADISNACTFDNLDGSWAHQMEMYLGLEIPLFHLLYQISSCLMYLSVKFQVPTSIGCGSTSQSSQAKTPSRNMLLSPKMAVSGICLHGTHCWQ